MSVAHELKPGTVPDNDERLVGVVQNIEHPGASQVRVGRFAVSSSEQTHAVSFDSALPDANYELFLQPLGDVAGEFWPSGLTAAGFTLNLSSGVDLSFSYQAVAR